MQQRLNFLQAAPEDELRLALGLQNYTSGKGKVELKDSSMRPIEIFMCSVVSLALPFAIVLAGCCAYRPCAVAFCSPPPQFCASLLRCEEWAMARDSAGCRSTSSDLGCTASQVCCCGVSVRFLGRARG